MLVYAMPEIIKNSRGKNLYVFGMKEDKNIVKIDDFIKSNNLEF